jgi:hypothetical protein
MKEHCKKSWPGSGMIFAGGIVLVVGLTIGLFREFDLPRYWIPAVIGALLILTGVIVRGAKNVYDQRDSQSRME